MPVKKGDAFVYHKVSPECANRISETRQMFRFLRDHIEATIPNTRERALCLTHLQTAALFATQARVLADPESEPQEE